MDLRRLKQRELATLCGVTQQAVAEWSKNGMPVGGRGAIDLEKALPWIIKSRYAPPGSERERLARAQAEKFELDNAVKRGELVRSEHHSDILMELTTATTSALDALPGRVAGELCAITDPALMRARLQDDCRAIRLHVADTLRKLADREVLDTDGGPDDDAAPPADAKPVGKRKPRAAAGKRRSRTVAK